MACFQLLLSFRKNHLCVWCSGALIPLAISCTWYEALRMLSRSRFQKMERALILFVCKCNLLAWSWRNTNLAGCKPLFSSSHPVAVFTVRNVWLCAGVATRGVTFKICHWEIFSHFLITCSSFVSNVMIWKSYKSTVLYSMDIVDMLPTFYLYSWIWSDLQSILNQSSNCMSLWKCHCMAHNRCL